VPIYEYECGLCQFRFERKQGFDEEPIAICPKCQGKVRRIFHCNPVIFKGSGFYTTDNHATDSRSTDSRSTDSRSTDSRAPDVRATDSRKGSPIEQARRKAQEKGK